MFNADLIVADITGHNPNVFYEIGLAHAAGCDTIMLQKGRKRISFGVAQERAVFYTETDRGLRKLESDLKKFL